MNKSLFILFILFTATSQAQEKFKLYGKILDTNGIGVDLASLTMVADSDSTLTISEYSDRDGSFEFNVHKQGSYHLIVRSLGFESFNQNNIVFSEANKVIDLGEIRLKSASKMLETVTIKSKTPYIERKIDRTIVNVDVLLSNTGSTVLEALERAPGVSFWLLPTFGIR